MRQAAMKNIGRSALFANNEGTLFALYDVLAMSAALNGSDYDAMNDAVQGSIELRHNRTFKGMEIEGVYAQKGYGPLMYLIGAHYAKSSGGLMATRQTGRVKPGAAAIWRNFYDGKGANLVTVIEMDTQHHKEPWLNIKIIPKKRIDLNGALRKNDRLIGRDPYEERYTALLEAADSVLMDAVAVY